MGTNEFDCSENSSCSPTLVPKNQLTATHVFFCRRGLLCDWYIFSCINCPHHSFINATHVMLIALFKHFKSIEIYEICKSKVYLSNLMLILLNMLVECLTKLTSNSISICRYLYVSFCFVSLNSVSFECSFIIFLYIFISIVCFNVHIELCDDILTTIIITGGKIKSIGEEMVSLLSFF